MKTETVGNREIRATRLSVSTIGGAIFDEATTHVEIEDWAAGEFVKVIQQSGHVKSDSQAIMIEHNEWPALKRAIEEMLNNCRKDEPKQEPTV